MQSSYVKTKGCHFLLYGVIRKKLNYCVCSGWIPVYVHFEFSMFGCCCQIEKRYATVLFVCRVEFYVIVYFVYICIDSVQVDFCCVEYD